MPCISVCALSIYLLLLSVSATTPESPSKDSSTQTDVLFDALVDISDDGIAQQIVWQLVKEGARVEARSPCSSASVQLFRTDERSLLIFSSRYETECEIYTTRPVAIVRKNHDTGGFEVEVRLGNGTIAPVIYHEKATVAVERAVALLKEQPTIYYIGKIEIVSRLLGWSVIAAGISICFILILGVVSVFCCVFCISGKNDSCKREDDIATRSCVVSLCPTDTPPRSETATLCISPFNGRKTPAAVCSAPSVSESTAVTPASLVPSEPATAMALLPTRTLAEKVDLPVTEEEFASYMSEVVKFSTDYVHNPAQFPVANKCTPGDIFKALPSNAPSTPEEFAKIIKDMRDVVLQGLVHWNHPRFHAFFANGRSYPDVLAETLVSTIGVVGFAWHASPVVTELEMKMMNWLGRTFNLPMAFLYNEDNLAHSAGGGAIMESASVAIFCAMLAARNKKIEKEMAKNELTAEHLSDEKRHLSMKYNLRGGICSKLVAYGSREAHSSFEKACHLAMVRCRSIRALEQNDWGLRKEQIEREMLKDLERGLIPFYIHVAIGTTSTAVSDHLGEIAPLGMKYGAWVHVDAAYAGGFWVEPSFRHNIQGLEMVDSLNINLHKQFLLSSTCSCIWTRHQKDFKRAFIISPVYLPRHSKEQDFRDWGIDLSRRFKGLKVWLLLRMYGVDGMRAYVNRLCTMTRYFESLIVTHPNVRKFGKTNYSLFCIRYFETGKTEKELSFYTKRLCDFLNQSLQIMFTHSAVNKLDIIRVAVNYERTTKADIEDSARIFTRLLNQFVKRKDDADLLEDHVSSKENSLLENSSKEQKVRPLMDEGVVGSPAVTVTSITPEKNQYDGGMSLVPPKTEASASTVSAASVPPPSPVNAPLPPSTSITRMPPLPRFP